MSISDSTLIKRLGVDVLRLLIIIISFLFMAVGFSWRPVQLGMVRVGMFGAAACATWAAVELYLLLRRANNPLRPDYLEAAAEAKYLGGRNKLIRQRNHLIFDAVLGVLMFGLASYWV